MRIGLDIGGTKVAAVLLDDQERLRAQSWHDHQARGLDAVADALAATADAVSEGQTVQSVGVSVSGLVRRDDGVLTGGASLEVYGDLAQAIADRLGRPVHVFNDAEATLRSVVAAHRATTGDDAPDSVLLVLGTGVGGAIISDGRPIRGASGLATELGHLPIGPTSEHLCVCGSSGCLEQFAGGKGIGERARLAIVEGRASDALRDAHERATDSITAKEVVDAAREGDDSALALVDDAACAIARAIRALCVTVEPTRIFLGGTIAHAASDLLLPRIQRHLEAWWPFASLTSPPLVQLDEIGPYAAAIGAAQLSGDADHTTLPHTVLEGPEND